MACFITPLALGLSIALIKRFFKNMAERVKLTILEITLLGGSAILAVEHIWRGEVVPYPPFLTAMSNPADIPVMINEMTIVGGLMSLASTTPWLTILSYNKVGLSMRSVMKKAVLNLNK
uniref:Uncharacterized protein n=1 Tax=Staphylothermus marinus TaxID=2280 RepID=A0A7C4NM70_STAMA